MRTSLAFLPRARYAPVHPIPDPARSAQGNPGILFISGYLFSTQYGEIPRCCILDISTAIRTLWFPLSSVKMFQHISATDRIFSGIVGT